MFDITIDALALHFLLKIDDDLVNEVDLNSIFSIRRGSCINSKHKRN